MKAHVSTGTAALALALAVAAGPHPAAAADYVLGPEDVITVSVWLHPELGQTVAIRSDGDITVPPIGDLKASGLTPKQLADRLGDRLSTYLRQTATVTVTVVKYMSQSVFVSGAVAHPGRYGFEKIPGLVEVLSGAGGALPGADLTRVQVVHREGEARTSIYVDVSSALRDGVGVNLPTLKAGDTVVVPMSAAGGAGAASTGEAVGVLGEVAKPGLYAVGEGQDLWAVLALAGGLTPRGDLADVRVVTRQDRSQAVITVDLRDALKRGRGAPFVVRPGDVVVVSPSGASTLSRSWAGFNQVLAVSRDLLNIVVLRDLLKKQ